MDRIENESSGLFCPGTADVFVRGKAFQDLETTGEIVSGDEVDQVGSELVVAVIVIAVDGRLFDRTVHPLDLPIGPWVTGLGQAMLDTVGSADLSEAVNPLPSRPAITIFWQVSDWIPLSVSTVGSRYGTAAISASKKRTAVGRSAF